MRAFAGLLLCLVAGFGADAAEPLRTAAALSRALHVDRAVGQTFELEAQVQFAARNLHPDTVVRDATGVVSFYDYTRGSFGPFPAAGDRIRVSGRTVCGAFGYVFANAERLEVVGHDELPEPVSVTAAQILRGDYDLTRVRFEGVIRDVFSDEIDMYWVYVVLQCGSDRLYATFGAQEVSLFGLDRLIGARVSVTGVPRTHIASIRRRLKGLVSISGPEAIAVRTPVGADLFAVPELEDDPLAPMPESFARRRIVGRVVAAWNGDRVLLRTATDRLISVQLAEKTALRYGTNVNGIPGIDVTCHGRALRLVGKVLDAPSPEDGCFNLGCDGSTLRVNAAAARQATEPLEVGCTVELCGTCVMDIPNWYPNAPFPHVNGFTIVVRQPSDVRGLTNKQIAVQLQISLESVKSHVKLVLEKLGASSRTEAASIALTKRRTLKA